MDFLSAVSGTALITLKARAVASAEKQPVINDAVAVECLRRLQPLLPPEMRARLLGRRLPSILVSYLAHRARKYDGDTRRFLRKYQDGLVVSLGCGFDTRYWRVSADPWNYIEVDLPDVVAAKKSVLGDLVTYPLIGGSVLEEDWLEQVSARQQKHVLFLAEGLFMYLPDDGVRGLFRRLAESFTASEITVEVVNDKYTRGLLKKMVASKIGTLGTQAGAYYDFGVLDAREVEAFGRNIRVVEEWSFIEDEDLRPRILRLLRHFRVFSRTQWTFRATINQDAG